MLDGFLLIFLGPPILKVDYDCVPHLRRTATNHETGRDMAVPRLRSSRSNDNRRTPSSKW